MVVKGKQMAMKGLVPKLRFPGHVQSWTRPAMSAVYHFFGGNMLSRDSLNYVDGPARNIHYGDIHTTFPARFDAQREYAPYINVGAVTVDVTDPDNCRAGDIVMADASEDMADIGKAIEVIDAGDRPLLAGQHTIHARPVNHLVATGFGACLFASPSVRRQIRREAQGAKVLGLSARRLAQIALPLPELAEQQKIADCLSSLDERIAAETRRLDALKTHKQGLLQQLFPRENETVPRLRFPRAGGSWKATRMSAVANLISGQHLAPDAYARDGEVPYFTGPSDFTNGLTGVTKWTSRSANVGIQGDTLITVKGSGVGELLHLSLGAVAMGRQLMAVHPRAVRGSFLFQFLGTRLRQLVALASGNLIPGLSRGDILRIELRIPGDVEQQKIADCLTSLDDLIVAQAKKIDLLKQHKRGLMQQLFPSIGGVDGAAGRGGRPVLDEAAA